MKTLPLVALLLVSCLHPAEERVERDLEVGRASHDGVSLTVDDGLAAVRASHTARYLFAAPETRRRAPREPQGWLELRGITRNNLRDLDARFPLGVLTAVTGVSGSGKSSLVSQALLELVSSGLGRVLESTDEPSLEDAAPIASEGRISAGLEQIRRLVQVDQKPIGRTPRSNLATYTGLFDNVRKLFAATPAAKKRPRDRSSGRCTRTTSAGSPSRPARPVSCT